MVAGEWTALARGQLGIPLVAGALDALLIALLISAIYGRRVDLRLHPLDVLVGAFAILSMLQMLNPNVPNAEIALEGFRKTAFTAVAYVIARLCAYSPARLAMLVAAGSLLALLFGIRQFFVPLPFDLEIIRTSGVAETTFYQANQLRAFSPMAGPFHLGLIASMVIVFGIALAMARDSRWLLPVLIGILALLLSISRANWVATVVAAIVVLLSAIPRSDVSGRKVVLAAGDPHWRACRCCYGDTRGRWRDSIEVGVLPQFNI